MSEEDVFPEQWEQRTGGTFKDSVISTGTTMPPFLTGCCCTPGRKICTTGLTFQTFFHAETYSNTKDTVKSIY